MTEQRLDDADVDTVLEQMGREAVPKGVGPDALVDARCDACFDDDAVQLSRAQRLQIVLAWEHPPVGMHHALLPPDLPPLP